MKVKLSFRTKTTKNLFFGLVFVQLFSFAVLAQNAGASVKTAAPAAAPKVTQIDAVQLKKLLQPNGKPLLINFWATWCEPCREEFPDLVKIDTDFKGKIDFITVSLDDPADLKGAVPKFLTEMKAEMPAYLLSTLNEDAAIISVSKDWQGGLPFTILYDAGGKTAYSRMGKVKIDVLRAEIEKTLVKPAGEPAKAQIENLPLTGEIYTYEKGIADAEKDIRNGKLLIRYFGLRPAAANESELNALLKKEYNIEINDLGCLVPAGYGDYAKGYNEISMREIKRRFGGDYLEKAVAKTTK